MFLICKLLLLTRFPVVSEDGLPLPSATLLLDNMLSSIFPPNFQTIHQAVATFENMNYMAKYLVETEPLDAISEFQVKKFICFEIFVEFFYNDTKIFY